MNATVTAMPRKKAVTSVVRIDKDLAHKARVISAAKGISVPEYLSDLLRQPIERDMNKEARKLIRHSDEQSSD